jgi:hypothetical protein
MRRRNSKWRRRCQHYRRRFDASFFAGGKRNKDVKAIVLRIDSPGGSVTSDLIWRELELTKKVKPIVVSMGIMPLRADTILRNANTILPKITPLPVL